MLKCIDVYFEYNGKRYLAIFNSKERASGMREDDWFIMFNATPQEVYDHLTLLDLPESLTNKLASVMVMITRQWCVPTQETQR